LEILVLERVYLLDRTLGSIYRAGQTIAKSMELPWKLNKRGVSCIPEGSYKVIRQPSKPGREYEYFRLPDVEGRSGILIHRGTEPTHSKGCILVASRFRNINTSKPSLEESGKKLQWMVDNLPAEFILHIKAKYIAA
jgi:hypothetical protein